MLIKPQRFQLIKHCNETRNWLFQRDQLLVVPGRQAGRPLCGSTSISFLTTREPRRTLCLQLTLQPNRHTNLGEIGDWQRHTLHLSRSLAQWSYPLEGQWFPILFEEVTPFKVLQTPKNGFLRNRSLWKPSKDFIINQQISLTDLPNSHVWNASRVMQELFRESTRQKICGEFPMHIYWYDANFVFKFTLEKYSSKAGVV